MADETVYSTEAGDLRNRNSKKKKKDSKKSQPEIRNDGIVRVKRESKGRGGKTVSVIYGLPQNNLTAIASMLKQKCGTGGTAKDGTVIIQGDKTAVIIDLLVKEGYLVKKAGG